MTSVKALKRCDTYIKGNSTIPLTNAKLIYCLKIQHSYSDENVKSINRTKYYEENERSFVINYMVHLSTTRLIAP
jgi:hypothetical protein